jgi:hypothetical protein
MEKKNVIEHFHMKTTVNCNHSSWEGGSEGGERELTIEI